MNPLLFLLNLNVLLANPDNCQLGLQAHHLLSEFCFHMICLKPNYRLQDLHLQEVLQFVDQLLLLCFLLKLYKSNFHLLKGLLLLLYFVVLVLTI